MTLLPELSEKDAAGEAASFYAEIRRLGGVPMVALIFRHLATRPGVLEWAWGAIGPAWRSGRLQEAAWRVAREVPLAPIARIHRPALRAVGVSEADERDIGAVLVAYNRANPENMLSMLCLQRMLGGASTASPPVARDWTPPAAPGPLPPMVDVATMPSSISDVLDLVAAPGEPGGPRVIQSLYRHFGHRPAFLALAITLLRQRFDDGSIDAEVAQVSRGMNAAADGIVRGLSAPACPDPSVRTIIDRFAGGVIPQMIVVGRLLENSVGSDPN